MAHFSVELFFKAQIAVGDNTHHTFTLDHREARDTVLLRERDHIADFHGGRNSDWVANHTRLEALDLRHLARLFFGGEIFVDDADTAFLGDGDRQPRLGDRIHRR